MTDPLPDLVIFDCDGVLIDSEAIACAIESAILAEIGHPINPDAFAERFIGTSRAYSLAALEADWGRPLPRDYVARVRARLEEAFRRELRAVDGMVPLVTALAGRCAVASSSSKMRLALTLGLTGFASLLADRVFSAEQVARGKPAPDLFLFVAESLGIDPSRCLVVEDSRFGIVAARAAGMTAIGFTAGGHCRPGLAAILTSAGADAIATNAPALARRIGL